MKRVLSLVLALVMLFSLAACSGAARRARVQIVTTSFPLYDWTRNIVGDTDGVEITWLMDSGVDPHSFQPTTKDLVFVSDCDVFVYVGGESEAWADDAVASMKNENAVVVKLLDGLQEAALAEEDVPGAEPEHEEEEEGALDEHIWMSLRAAERCVDLICDALCEADSANDDVYRMNADDYKAQLSALDQAYTEAVASSGARHDPGRRPLPVPLSRGGLSSQLLCRLRRLLGRDGGELPDRARPLAEGG